MAKKLISFALALFCVASMAVVGVSAAEDTTIYFEVPQIWENYFSVYCHIWEYGGDSLTPWQGKKEKCTKVEDGLYSYDISKAGTLEEGKFYGVIFSIDIGLQTYDTLMTTDCIGDTLYSDGTIYENPQDSTKTCFAAFWRNQDPTVYGPIKQITSIGNVIGTCCPPGVTNESLFEIFLTERLDYARAYGDKDDQRIIDDLIYDLGLSVYEADEIIKSLGTEVDWEIPDRGEPSTDDEPATDDEFELGDVNKDGKLNIRDATVIQKYLAKLADLDEEALILADYDLNEKVNIKDATAIQKKLAKVI